MANGKVSTEDWLPIWSSGDGSWYSLIHLWHGENSGSHTKRLRPIQAVSRKNINILFKFFFFFLIRIHDRANKFRDCVNTCSMRFARRWPWRMPSYGMWRRVDLVWTDVSEERIASISRIEKSTSEEPAWAGACRSQSLRGLRHELSSFARTLGPWVRIPLH
jgi:hypothetical protein